MLPQQSKTGKITILSTSIAVPAARLDALHRDLLEAADAAQAPSYPYEHTEDLLDHLRLVWEWTAHLEGGRLCRLLPDRDYVDIAAMEQLFRVFAPYVEAHPDLPCHFAYREDTGEGAAFRYLFHPGVSGQPDSARVSVQPGELRWLSPGARAPRRTVAVILTEIRAEIGQEACPPAAPLEAGRLLARCLEQAHLFERAYREANRRADHEEAELVDTQYMEDHLVYPLQQAAKLRRLALELLLDHQVWPDGCGELES